MSGARGQNPADAGPEMNAVAEHALQAAQRAGATHAEVVVQHGRAFSVKVQGGHIDTLKQSSAHGLGLRVLVGQRIGFVSTTDFRAGALDDLARRAVALAAFATEDEANGFATPVDSMSSTSGWYRLPMAWSPLMKSVFTHTQKMDPLLISSTTLPNI